MVKPRPTSDAPPFMDLYHDLISGSCHNGGSARTPLHGDVDGGCQRGEHKLPVIDLGDLTRAGEETRRACVAAIAKASSEWGFFQVVNHGFSRELLEEMRRVQVRLFERTFDKKAGCGLLGSYYTWGTPTATSAHQVSWSERFHFPLAKILAGDEVEDPGNEKLSYSREVMGRFSGAVWELARELVVVLTENLQGHQAGRPSTPAEICSGKTCFLRLNRYPRCPVSAKVMGIVSHTDSDFLTIVFQDQVGGLQLRNDDGEWVAVKPNPDALVVNIGDLFQAWSNDVYKSVEHRVVAGGETERYSIAYFMCPAEDAVVGSCGGGPSTYRRFTFEEYRRQVAEDVKSNGQKVGLSNFLLP
ncbi:hypothetical protein Taro_049096 [Colocasia esculenta]|uniref:Fe2OG dioxygenase domain-containing protein n=1 Tax=Colocasia esculenta TaxID=4460 RepID=A0A843X9Y9_COLES|nr:hypothetical protein [Colocasia esculenta]